MVQGQDEIIKVFVGGGAEYSWVVRGDSWDDIKETEVLSASLGRLFCGMKE